MSISVTHLNFTDIERRLRDTDPRIRVTMLEMVESLITLEQALNELKAIMAQAIATEASGMALLRNQLNRVERRFDNTGLVSFSDPKDE